jgi:hypothetical protein
MDGNKKVLDVLDENKGTPLKLGQHNRVKGKSRLLESHPSTA